MAPRPTFPAMPAVKLQSLTQRAGRWKSLSPPATAPTAGRGPKGTERLMLVKPLPVSQRSQDGIQYIIQPFSKIIAQETEHEIPMLLKRGVFSSVAPVSFSIRQMVAAIQLDYQPRSFAQEIHFHPALLVEGDGETHIQPEAACRRRKCFEATVEKSFARAARAFDAFGLV